jgi:TonB family protein
MAHSPALRPDPSEPVASPSSDRESTVANEPDVAEMTTELAAHGIESSELSLDLILHDIAERARQATGASGAAIALERDGIMVCRAAAGSTAPDLGVRINTESGLTAACVREERAQWCPDTDADDRVDAEACRQLQVRCIVVVPLFSRERLIGVFEIFSGQPRAFGERELRALQELAIWVTEAVKGDSVKGTSRAQVTVQSSASTPASVSRSNSALVPLLTESVSKIKSDDRGTKILRAIVLALAVLLCVLLGYRWGWQKARLAKQVNPPVTAPVDDVSRASGGELTQTLTLTQPSKPSPAGRRLSDNGDSAMVRGNGNASQSAGSVQPEPTGRKENASDREVLSKDSSAAGNSRPTGNDGQTTEPSSQRAALEPSVPLPSAGVHGVSASILPPLAAGVPDKPVSLGVPISRGVTPGRLIRRVDPSYPSMALQQRISGPVQLEARIGTDGRVHNIKVLKGHPFLATAAVDAVRQWQYEPYKLNGQPVDLQTQITINFNLP